MTTTTILIVSAIVLAFMVFGVVLAWGDSRSRRARQANMKLEPPASSKSPASRDVRKAA